MSINPVTQYPGKVAPATPDNPFGTARNITIPGDGTGTPWESALLKDEWALHHAMLLNAGMEPNGTPDSAENSQLFKAAKASIGNGANLLSNHNFLIASPDVSQPPPDATPRSYPPGFQILSGVFANETTGITGLTYINGRVSFTAGDFYIPRANSKELENITEFVASVADFDGKPRTRGVSYALVGDEYRVTVGVDALEDVSATLTPLGSVKFEHGSVATGHEVQSAKGIDYTFSTLGELVSANPPVGSVAKTKGRHSQLDGGFGVYDIVSSTTFDGYADVQLDTGKVAKLRLSDTGFADFRQVGIKVFESEADPDFESVDSGVILNALNNSRVLGLKSKTYGRVYLKTQHIDTKGMYFVAPLPSNIDQVDENSFKIVADSAPTYTQPLDGTFVVKSGVRRGGIVGMILKVPSGSGIKTPFSFGDARYNDDTDNIISNYYTDGFYTQGGDYGVFAYQYFNCQFNNTQNRNFNIAAWWTEEGGTSCHWVNCFPLSSALGAKGFVWNPDVETQGHIYSSMTGCAPQLVSDESYVFRNCNMTLTSCAEEFSSYNSDSSMLFVGTGNYVINNYSLVNRNTDKPKNIYGVKPTPAGRFGASLTIDGTTLGVTGFSGAAVGFMHYGAEPTSILSRAKWDVSNANQKADPTSAIDYESWKSGYYYNNFVILKSQLEEIETYTRSGQNTAIIEIDANTRHTITGEITTASGSAYVTFEVDTGNKTLSTASRVDVIATASSDATNRGKVLHIDSGLDQTYSTGNVYLRSFHKAGIDIFASFSAGFLRVEFEAGGSVEGQAGIWTITRRRSANL